MAVASCELCADARRMLHAMLHAVSLARGNRGQAGRSAHTSHDGVGRAAAAFNGQEQIVRELLYFNAAKVSLDETDTHGCAETPPPRPQSSRISGIAFERPPAPTSWMKKIGLSSPMATQRSITSWQRRSISGLPRWTDAKSRSSALVPVAIDEAAPPRDHALRWWHAWVLERFGEPAAEDGGLDHGEGWGT